MRYGEKLLGYKYIQNYHSWLKMKSFYDTVNKFILYFSDKL